MPDPNKFVEDVAKSLDQHGVWIIQQNYLLTTMELSAVDNFCHEHIEYYTLKSLERLLEIHWLAVNEVYLSMVNGGSIRTVV
jgi:NDP-4-keto-2,6-dideoxyhexose 3-C-methyltransferase